MLVVLAPNFWASFFFPVRSNTSVRRMAKGGFFQNPTYHQERQTFFSRPKRSMEGGEAPTFTGDSFGRLDMLHYTSVTPAWRVGQGTRGLMFAPPSSFFGSGCLDFDLEGSSVGHSSS